jgi:hypothetical protein
MSRVKVVNMTKTPEARYGTTLRRRRSHRQGGLPRAGSAGRFRSAALTVHNAVTTTPTVRHGICSCELKCVTYVPFSLQILD